MIAPLTPLPAFLSRARVSTCIVPARRSALGYSLEHAMRCDGDTLALQNQQHQARFYRRHIAAAERAAADMMMAHSANRANRELTIIDVPVRVGERPRHHIIISV